MFYALRSPQISLSSLQLKKNLKHTSACVARGAIERRAAACLDNAAADDVDDDIDDGAEVDGIEAGANPMLRADGEDVEGVDESRATARMCK